MRVACWISKAKRTYTHAHSRAPRHPHACTRARTHTQTNMWYLLLFDGNNCFANASFYVHCPSCLYRRYYDGAYFLPSFLLPSLPSFHPCPTFLSFLTHLNFILLFLLILLLLYFRNLFFFPTLHYSILDSFTNLFSSFLLVILTSLLASSLLASSFPFLSYCVCNELVWLLTQNVTCLC